MSRISRIVKTLLLAVFHKSFTSSASFWESTFTGIRLLRILIKGEEQEVIELNISLCAEQDSSKTYMSNLWEIDTLHADAEDKELLISELQDSLAATENEIALLQIRVADAEDRRAEDHEQIQKILARLGL
ncbi:hypothetical protein Tco_1395332 [Tanacetum coccineum]